MEQVKSTITELNQKIESARRNARDLILLYYRLGSLSESIRLYYDAISYYKSFLEIVIEAGDLLGEALAYNHLGICHFQIQSSQHLEKAIEYHLNHLEMSRDSSNIASQLFLLCKVVDFLQIVI